MDTHSVETEPPPEQVAIAKWRVWMGVITLEPVGDTGKLWFNSDAGARKPFGDVQFDADRDRYVVAWNRWANMTLGRYQIDVIDPQIHYAMRNRR